VIAYWLQVMMRSINKKVKTVCLIAYQVIDKEKFAQTG